MSIQSILAEFGSRSGMGALSLNAQGVCRMIFDNEYTVDLEAVDGAAGGVLVTCVVGPFEGDSGPTARQLLSANLTGRETGGAALALDDASEEVVLTRTLPTASLGYQEFEKALQDFVAAAERWRNVIDGAASAEDGEVPEGEAEEPAPAADDTMMFRV